MSDLFETQYNPDVLSCLANLSNDEVFTPPEVANQMLDLLPPEIWEDPSITVFDPACKTGVFLRECAKRFIEGQLPGYKKRVKEIEDKKHEDVELDEADESYLMQLESVVEHVFKHQLYGMAITELTSLLSRRSVYCSKWPNGDWSVVKFDNPEGNIDYKRMEHDWYANHCTKCGVGKSRTEYTRDEEHETYAYEFIHLDYPEEVFNMKFDVIVSNPPYQMSDGGQKASATPIYNKFIEQAIKLNPKYLSMIIPSRWFDGGRGLDKFRKNMLSDKRMAKIVDYQNSADCFPGVDIAGGVCYFLWERDHAGLCEVDYISGGHTESSLRKLDEYSTFIRSSRSLEIVNKILSMHEDTLDTIVSSQKPYGLRTYARPTETGDLVLKWNGGEGPFPRSEITSGIEWIYKWKVFTSYLTHDHAGQTDNEGKRRVISVLETACPGKVCTETYLSIGAFDTEDEARNLENYIRTKFVRFLILQLTSTQHLAKGNFAFVPMQDFKIAWTDETLATKYDLTCDDISYIDSKVKPMDIAGDGDE